ncbi:hypothetical protein IAT38_001661 [Cryptococcus sp. DSM 104549]
MAAETAQNPVSADVPPKHAKQPGDEESDDEEFEGDEDEEDDDEEYGDEDFDDEDEDEDDDDEDEDVGVDHKQVLADFYNNEQQDDADDEDAVDPDEPAVIKGDVAEETVAKRKADEAPENEGEVKKTKS